MHWTEIFAIVFLIGIVFLYVFFFVRKRIKGQKSSCCGSKSNKLVHSYHKKYGKKDKCSCCEKDK